MSEFSSAVPDLEFAGLSGELVIHHNSSAKADINIMAVPRAEQRAGRQRTAEDDVITIIWEYATGLFTEDSMRRMADAYRQLLLAALTDTSLRLSQLPLASSASGECDGATSIPSMMERIDHHVQCRPTDAAVTTADSKLTYAALNRSAEKLSERLRNSGAGPHRPVVTILERGIALITAMVAAAKVDAPLRLIDPAHPDEAGQLSAGSVLVTRERWRHLATNYTTVVDIANSDVLECVSTLLLQVVPCLIKHPISRLSARW